MGCFYVKTTYVYLFSVANLLTTSFMKDSRNECQNPQVIQEILPINAWFQKSDEKQCKFLFYALQKSLKQLVLVTSR